MAGESDPLLRPWDRQTDRSDVTLLTPKLALSFALFLAKKLHLSFSPLNPLSAKWRIYPSSKWSSQWQYDGYIRHGWMTSCGRGRDSATPECFGRGSQGMIFVRSSKISLFFPELCSFRRVFCFPCFCKIWRQTFELWGFGFRWCLGAFFENSTLSPGIFFANFEYDHEYFLKISFIFSKQSRCHLPDSYGDLQAEQSTFVMVCRKLEWNLTSGSWRDRALNSSKDRQSSSRSVWVACGDPWSKREKTQWSQCVIERSINPSRLKTTLWSSHAFSEYIYWPNSEREKKGGEERWTWRERERKRRFGVNWWWRWLMMALTPKRLFLSFSLSLHVHLSSPPFFSRSLLGQ